MLEKKRRLGRTDQQVSLTGLGAWAIGGKSYGAVDDSEGQAVIRRYIENGGNHIDTANAYGQSEVLIGKALNELDRNHHLILSSKAQCDGREESLSKVEEALTQSLRDLKRDYIDVFYLHSPPDKGEAMDRLLDLYKSFQKKGYIRYIGASIKGVNVTEETVDLARVYIEDGRTDVLQLVYSVFRQRNSAIFDLADRHDIGIVGRTALESGFLTGKYKKGHHFRTSDHRSRWDRQTLDRILEEAEGLKEYAMTNGYDSLAHLAFRFAMDNPSIDSVIMGAKNLQQLEENNGIEALPGMSQALRDYLIKTYGDFTDYCNT